MIPTLALLGTVIIAFNNVQHSAADAIAKVEELKGDDQRQFGELRGALTAGLAGVQAQIATLPDMSARLSALERRAQETAQHLGALDGRADDANRLIWQTNADVSSMLKASRR